MFLPCLNKVFDDDEDETVPGGGGYSPKFRIGVCRKRSQTLTLSKDKENEN